MVAEEEEEEEQEAAVASVEWEGLVLVVEHVVIEHSTPIKSLVRFMLLWAPMELEEPLEAAETVALVALVGIPRLRQTTQILQHLEFCVWLVVAVAEKEAPLAQQICPAAVEAELLAQALLPLVQTLLRGAESLDLMVLAAAVVEEEVDSALLPLPNGVEQEVAAAETILAGVKAETAGAVCTAAQVEVTAAEST